LQYLDLRANQLTGVLSGDVCIATLYEPLVSPSCPGSIPAELGQLSNLVDLTLRDNQLIGL
jgi:hypothetical protein